MSEERWTQVKGYEGLYEISTKGRIKHYTTRFGWRIEKHTNKKGWYYTVNLYDENRKRKTVRIHRLVAEHFIGEIPNGYHVHHKDGNKQNNDVDNLEIVHPCDHVQETIEQNENVLKGMINRNKFIHPRRIQQYTKDGFFVAEYANSVIASMYTGVCERNILQVAHKKEGRKQAGGFIWVFAEEKGGGDK